MKSDDSETTVRNDDGITAVTLDAPFFPGLTMDGGDAPNGDVMIAKESANGIAPATRRAYKTDVEHFRAWAGSYRQPIFS